MHANKVLERSLQKLWINTGTTMHIDSQNSGILQGSIELLSNDCML